MSSAAKRVTVSISKLAEFLTKRLYTIIAVYVCEDSIRFVEAKTAKYQKSFMIYISKKYKMVPGDSHKKVIISLSNGDSSRQLEYLDKLKGSFIECDLTSVSSRFVCVYRNNGSLEMYFIGTKQDIEDDSMEIVKETPIQKVIKDASDVFESLTETLTIPDISEGGNLEENEMEEGDSEEDISKDSVSTKDEHIELEFEDADGESVSDMAEFIEPPPFRESNITEKSKDIKSIHDIDMEDEDIVLGIIYHTIDLLIFYKSINNLEEKIASIYNIIEDNENALRDERVSTIEEMAEGLVLKIHSAQEKFITEENRLKTQLVQLSSIFDQTTDLKEKIKIDVKYSDAKGDIERVYNQTRNTIKDLNLELLHLRDYFDELLDNVHTSLEELTR